MNIYFNNKRTPYNSRYQFFVSLHGYNNEAPLSNLINKRLPKKVPSKKKIHRSFDNEHPGVYSLPTESSSSLIQLHRFLLSLIQSQSPVYKYSNGNIRIFILLDHYGPIKRHLLQVHKHFQFHSVGKWYQT